MVKVRIVADECYPVYDLYLTKPDTEVSEELYNEYVEAANAWSRVQDKLQDIVEKGIKRGF